MNQDQFGYHLDQLNSLNLFQNHFIFFNAGNEQYQIKYDVNSVFIRYFDILILIIFLRKRIIIIMNLIIFALDCYKLN